MGKKFKSYHDWKKRRSFGEKMPGYIHRRLVFEQIGGLLLLFVVLPAACVWQDGLPYREAYFEEAERQQIINDVWWCQSAARQRSDYQKQAEQMEAHCVQEIYGPAEERAIANGNYRWVWWTKK
jgi:hypothetical protein